MATLTAIPETETDLEVMSWQTALIEKNRSIRLRSLSPEMLNEEGEVITVGEKEDTTSIRLDEEFVYYALVERILKPLGLVAQDGSVKEKYITTVFLPKALEYAKKENERSAIQRRLELATQMALFNGRTVDQNVELLKAKDEIED